MTVPFFEIGRYIDKQNFDCQWQLLSYCWEKHQRMEFIPQKIKILFCIKFNSTYFKEVISQISTYKVLDHPNHILNFVRMLMPFP